MLLFAATAQGQSIKIYTDIKAGFNGNAQPVATADIGVHALMSSDYSGLLTGVTISAQTIPHYGWYGGYQTNAGIYALGGIWAPAFTAEKEYITKAGPLAAVGWKDKHGKALVDLRYAGQTLQLTFGVRLGSNHDYEY